MNTNIKSAIFGGLAATFVVAASFGPKLMSSDHPSPAAVVVSSSGVAVLIAVQCPIDTRRPGSRARVGHTGRIRGTGGDPG